jgi:DNA topoisomerase-1
LRATGRVLLFDGFLRVWQEPEEKDNDDEPQTLPEMAIQELLDLLALIPKQRFTQPPPRYTESALVKALEERGIGRPSTYAAILKTLKERTYVELEQRTLSPTTLGEATCDALIAAFPEVMDYQFTAQVEDWLDDISRGERDWVKALQAFYDPFQQALQAAPAKMAAFPRPPQSRPVANSAPGKAGSRRRRAAPSQPDPNVACPKCGAPMVKRTGSRGDFWGCSKYPTCKGTRHI